MHNAIFPVRIDEIVHPRVSNESFLKVFIQPRRAITSSPSDEDTGLSNQSDIAVLLKNYGDSDVSFKVMGARRSHAAENQANDASYSEVVPAQTLKAGGFLQLLLQEEGLNLFSFVMTSSSNSRMRVEASSAADLIVWKSFEREGEKGTHLDTFLSDEAPKVFYSTSSPSSGD
jgi:hypothetical protein